MTSTPEDDATPSCSTGNRSKKKGTVIEYVMMSLVVCKVSLVREPDSASVDSCSLDGNSILSSERTNERPHVILPSTTINHG